MKTTVYMKRELMGLDLIQRSDNNYFSMRDLITIGNKWRIENKKPQFNQQDYLRLNSTKEFMEVVKNRTGQEPIIVTRGRGKTNWLHPFIFLDMATVISADFKFIAYNMIIDNLTGIRNDSGDSFKKMTGALFENATDTINFKKYIINVSAKIRTACNLAINDKWENATEEQLKLRDKIQENISQLAGIIKKNDNAVEIGILMATNKLLEVK